MIPDSGREYYSKMFQPKRERKKSKAKFNLPVKNRLQGGMEVT